MSAAMTVGALRRLLAELPDDMPVCLEVSDESCGADLAQADLERADVEERCDEVPRLYLFGETLVDGDDEEAP